MNDVRSAISGTAARTLPSVFRKISAPAPRFIAFSTAGDPCCSGTSKYLQMLSCFAIVSSKRPVIRFG